MLSAKVWVNGVACDWRYGLVMRTRWGVVAPGVVGGSGLLGSRGCREEGPEFLLWLAARGRP
jgi:hypothetical protein